MTHRIPPRSGTGFTLAAGEILTVIDPEGEQVADLIAFSEDDPEEYISSGRSIDYASRIFLTTGDLLYSNRSRPMFSILEDTVGRHDFLLAPCSREMFEIIYGKEHSHQGCQGNLEKAIAPFGIKADRVPIAFNIFMHVDVNGSTGEIKVLTPRSKAGDSITLQAEIDLIVGLTACSAGQSNNFEYKPIDYTISRNHNPR